MSYPTTITEQESDLGFEAIRLRDPAQDHGQGNFVPVVVCVLSESDILLKIGEGLYSHRRWGAYEGSPIAHLGGWHPVGSPIIDIEAAVHRLKLGFDEEFGPRIIGRPFPRVQ